jgi:hypothetical protein
VTVVNRRMHKCCRHIMQFTHQIRFLLVLENKVRRMLNRNLQNRLTWMVNFNYFLCLNYNFGLFSDSYLMLNNAALMNVAKSMKSTNDCTAYICENFEIKNTISDPQELKKLLH